MIDIKLTDLLDVNVLQKLQDGFAKFTGMAALTTDANGIPVTKGSNFTDFCMNLTRKSELGRKCCEECDKKGALMTLQNSKTAVYSCHAGLVDYAAPIMVDGQFIGSFIGGQIRTNPVVEEDVILTARRLNIDENAYLEAIYKTNVMTMQDVEKAAEFLYEIANVLSEMAYDNYVALNNSQKLERTARSQTEFIINMSSEIQNNMKKWFWNASEVLENKDYSSMENLISQFIANSSDYIISMENTIEYTKITGGEIELSEISYNIRDLVKKACVEVQELATSMELDFKVNIDENIPESLLGYAGKIEKIINTLSLEAMNYTINGGVYIDISCNQHGYSTDLIISIKDTGRGMNLTEKSEIISYLNNDMSDLCQLDDNKERNATFSTIGFLVKQMSGSIKVESELNIGTTFTITIPQLKIS